LPVVWTATSRSMHVLLDRTLGNFNTKLQKLTTDSLCSPKPVLSDHTLDELNCRLGQRGSAHSTRLGFAAPQQPQSFTVPVDDRVRLHEENCLPPATHDARQEYEQASFVRMEAWLLEMIGRGRKDSVSFFFVQLTTLPHADRTLAFRTKNNTTAICTTSATIARSCLPRIPQSCYGGALP